MTLHFWSLIEQKKGCSVTYMGSVFSPWTGLAACIPLSTLQGKMKVLLGSIFRKIISMIIKNSWSEFYMSLFQFYSKLLRAQHWTDTRLHFFNYLTRRRISWSCPVNLVPYMCWLPTLLLPITHSKTDVRLSKGIPLALGQRTGAKAEGNLLWDQFHQSTTAVCIVFII